METTSSENVEEAVRTAEILEQPANKKSKQENEVEIKWLKPIPESESSDVYLERMSWFDDQLISSEGHDRPSLLRADAAIHEQRQGAAPQNNEDNENVTMKSTGDAGQQPVQGGALQGLGRQHAQPESFRSSDAASSEATISEFQSVASSLADAQSLVRDQDKKLKREERKRKKQDETDRQRRKEQQTDDEISKLQKEIKELQQKDLAADMRKSYNDKILKLLTEDFGEEQDRALQDLVADESCAWECPRDGSGMTALHKAIRLASANTITSMVRKWPEAVNDVTEVDCTEGPWGKVRSPTGPSNSRVDYQVPVLKTKRVHLRRMR